MSPRSIAQVCDVRRRRRGSMPTARVSMLRLRRDARVLGADEPPRSSCSCTIVWSRVSCSSVAAAQPVEPRIADVSDAHAAVVPQADDERRAHAGVLGVALRAASRIAALALPIVRGDRASRRARRRAVAARGGRRASARADERRRPCGSRLRRRCGRPCRRRAPPGPRAASAAMQSSLCARTRPRMRRGAISSRGFIARASSVTTGCGDAGAAPAAERGARAPAVAPRPSSLLELVPTIEHLFVNIYRVNAERRHSTVPPRGSMCCFWHTAVRAGVETVGTLTCSRRADASGQPTRGAPRREAVLAREIAAGDLLAVGAARAQHLDRAALRRHPEARVGDVRDLADLAR